MSRADRRRHAGHRPRPTATAAGVEFYPLDLRAQLLAEDLDAPRGMRALVAGAALAARAVSTTDGTEETITAARQVSHDEVIAFVDDAGGTRLGPVQWRVADPATRDAMLAHPDAGATLGEAEAMREWFAEHPEGWIVMATVVALPPAGVVPR